MLDSPTERRRVTRALSTALAVTLTTGICAFGAMSPASAVADPEHPFGLSVVADQDGPGYVLVATWNDSDPKPSGPGDDVRRRCDGLRRRAGENPSR